jgi:putative DNA primase/helicase
MPHDAEQPTNEQRLHEAKIRLETLLAQPTLTASEVFAKDILEALAWIEAGDYAAFATIKDRLKQLKISTRDLGRALEPYRHLRIVRDDDIRDKTAGDYLPNAPLPDLIIPPAYSLDDQATCRMTVDEHGVPQPLAIAYAPVLITGRLQSIEDGGQWLRLAWKRGGHWHHADVNRGVVMDARKLLELASQGFPIATDNAAHISHYLHELEAVNYQIIPTAQLATRMGWQGERGVHGFLCGRTLARAEETVNIDDLSSVPTTAWDAKWIAFHPLAAGDEQIADGFHTRGTYEGWANVVNTIIPYPRVRLALYASFAGPLLEILHVPGFGIDWSARTSVGKTSTLRVVASPWGCPDERRPGESIVFSWNSTKVWAERAAAAINGLPFILDESKLAAKGVVPAVLYMVANGIGKGRGNLRGLAPSKRWQTILFSTGESPITGFSEDGGSRMRVLAVRGFPFGVRANEIRKIVSHLNAELLLNYGHAGPRFIQWLLQERAQWSTWEDRLAELAAKFRAMVDDDAAYRLADYVAVIELAGELVHQALVLPWKHAGVMTKPLWAAIVSEASGAAGDERALRDVISWAYSHQESFVGRATLERDGTPRAPSYGWSGRWDKGDSWTEIGFYPTVLKRVLSECGYDPEAIISLWKENEWFVRGPNSKNLGKATRVLGEFVRLYTFARATVDKLDILANGADV